MENNLPVERIAGVHEGNPTHTARVMSTDGTLVTYLCECGAVFTIDTATP